jgi:hypothetical protein
LQRQRRHNPAIVNRPSTSAIPVKSGLKLD